MVACVWSDGPACMLSSRVSISMVCDSGGWGTVVVVDCISVGSACG